MNATKTYEEGLQDGQIKALEQIVTNHATRLDSHSARLRQMERMIWLIVGGLAFLQAVPTIAKVIESLSG